MNKLTIIATPIGNLDDITLRALNHIQNSDLVICENKDKIVKLMQKHDIDYKNKIFKQYNDKSTEDTRISLIKLIKEEFSKAILVSDAGTPLISDPGYKLVRELINHNIELDYLPGACAAIMSLILSGFPTDKFIFLGFLPKKGVKNILTKYINLNTTIILYESLYRIDKTLDLIFELYPDAEISILREGTKLYQEVIRFAKDSRPEIKLKGEFTVCIK